MISEADSFLDQCRPAAISKNLNRTPRDCSFRPINSQKLIDDHFAATSVY